MNWYGDIMKIKSTELNKMWCRHAYVAVNSHNAAAPSNRKLDGNPMCNCLGKQCPDFAIYKETDDEYYEGYCTVRISNKSII